MSGEAKFRLVWVGKRVACKINFVDHTEGYREELPNVLWLLLNEIYNKVLAIFL